MHLQSEILKEHSKKQTDKIATWVSQDSDRFKVLMALLLHGDDKIRQRSAWIARQVAARNPCWIEPYLRQLLLCCKEPVHAAVKRNVMGILQHLKLPEELQGLAATVCFDFLLTPGLPVAIKVFAMTVLCNITMDQPDMRHELKVVIEEQMEYEKPAFKSRGVKILKKLSKLI